MSIKRTKNIGILLMLASTLSFSAMQAVVKLSPLRIGTMQQMFFRNLIILFIVGGMMLGQKRSFRIQKADQPFLWMRCITGFIALYLQFYSVTYANLADANLLMRTTPIFVTIFAAIFLKEKISKVQIPVILLCFLGAGIAMGPSMSSNALPLTAALLNAAFSGVSYTIIAYSQGKIDPLAIVFYFSAFTCVACGVYFIFAGFVWLTVAELGMMLLIGVFGGIGQITLTYSYQMAPASEMSIYNYSGIVFSALLGYLLLQEVPTISTVIGAVLITGASLWAYHYERRHPAAAK